MKNANSEILSLFSAYLANKIPIGDFQERIALAHWSIERDAPELSKLIYQAVGKLSEFSRGHRTEDSLREELANAIAPFVYSGMEH